MDSAYLLSALREIYVYVEVYLSTGGDAFRFSSGAYSGEVGEWKCTERCLLEA